MYKGIPRTPQNSPDIKELKKAKIESTTKNEPIPEGIELLTASVIPP